jgi:predicted RNA-binding protein YlqC (UPF0109 family)
MDKLKRITNTIRTNVELLVDSPADVCVESFPLGDGASIRVNVASTDLGRIIGKQGRTARALRVIVSAMGMATKQKVRLDIAEP